MSTNKQLRNWFELGGSAYARFRPERKLVDTGCATIKRPVSWPINMRIGRL